MPSSYTLITPGAKRSAKGCNGTVVQAIVPNAPVWLRAWVQHNFRRALLLPSREENVNSLGAAVQHNFRRALLLPSREENVNSLGAAVQHNFKRALLLPSRKENIRSLGTAVQHNFRRALLLPSREENINSLGAAVQHNSSARYYCHLRGRISVAWALRYSITSSARC